MDIFWGRYKTELLLVVIFIHLGLFLKVKVQNGDMFGGSLIFQICFGVCPIFLKCFGGDLGCWQ